MCFGARLRPGCAPAAGPVLGWAQGNGAVTAATLGCVWKAQGRNTSHLLCLTLWLFEIIVNTEHELGCRF